MKEEMNDILIHCEKEEEIHFSASFKCILGLSIGLTGLLSFAGIISMANGIVTKIWEKFGVNDFLYQSLFHISIFLCLVSMVSIAATRKPFSKVLFWCFMSIGILFLISSFVFPHIPGYNCSYFVLFQSGKFTLIDGTILVIGILEIVFSFLIHYGFIYQRNTDMTV